MYHPLDNLAEDIYRVAGSEHFSSDIKSLAAYGARIAAHTEETLNSQQSRTEKRKDHTLRASELGSACLRQLWYKVYHPELAAPITGKMGFKFLYGDLIEEATLFLAEAAGYSVQNRQGVVTTEHRGWEIVGHMDAIINDVTVDVKSASDYAFSEVARNNYVLDPSIDKFGYNYQLGFYDLFREDQTLTDPRFLYVNKQSGEIRTVTPGPTVRGIEERLNVITKMLDVSDPNTSFPALPPVRLATVPHNKSGNTKLCTNCSYCSFRKDCYPKAKGFAYASGPIWLVDIVKIPDVPEIEE